MSGLAEISQRVARLTEIRGIMTAMKSLSLVETRKLARFIDHQRAMLANIEAAAADFADFFPPPAEADAARVIVLLIGSERGFCGNFNERVLSTFHDLPAWPTPPQAIAVGRRLCSRLASAALPATMIAQLDGPGTTEDVPTVLNGMMDAIRLASRHAPGDVALHAVSHVADGEIHAKRLLPLPAAPRGRFAYPPQLQLPAAEFFAGLLDHYLLAAMHGLIYESLVAENRQRQAHMEFALDRLGETLDRLALKRNALRQERIIEEIEVMLSSEAGFADTDGSPNLGYD